MPHINLPSDFPGIMGLFKYREDTAKPINEFAEVLMRGESPLSAGERDLIAAYVSYRNECNFCTGTHSAIARQLLKEKSPVVDAVKQDIETADLSDKMKALLKIAGKVRVGGNLVNSEDVEEARKHDASDRELHDTVLIAAAFCMFNRYVDGLANRARVPICS